MSATVSELVTKLSGDMTDLDRKLESADRSVDSFASGISKKGKMIALGVGAIAAGSIAAIAKESLGASIAFEAQFAEVRKTVDATDSQLNTLRNTIRDMATSSENPLSALENAHETLTGIMAMGGALGIATDDLATFTETVGAMTVATNMGAEEAANFMARFANVTGIDASQFRNVGNAIVDLGNNMAASETEIASFAERIAPLATYDFSAADILGYSSALASLGVSAELGGTNLLKTVGAITEATATGENLQGFAEAAGMTADEFKNLNDNDPSGALLAFVDGLSQMDADEQIISLKNLGITSQEQISLLQRMAAGFETVEQGLGLANSAFVDSNALMEEAAAKANTTAGKLNLLHNVGRNLAITIGDKMKPAFDDFLDVAIRSGIALNKLLTGEMTVGDIGNKIAAELDGIDLSGIFAAVQGALSGLGIDIDFGAVASSIRGALTTALSNVGIAPEEITTFATTAWSSISGALDGATVDFSSVTSTIGGALGEAMTDVSGAEIDTSGITTFAETHFTDIVELVSIAAGVIFGGPVGLAIGAGKLLAAAIESDFLGIGTFLDTSGIGAEVERVAGEIKSQVEGIFESVFSGGGEEKAAASFGPQFAPGLEIGDYQPKADALDRFASRLKTGVDVLKDALGGIGADLGVGLTDLGAGIKGFIDSLAGTETEGLLDIATAIGGAIGAVALGVGQLAGFVAGGILTGIGAALPPLGSALSDFISAISRIGKGDFGGAFQKFGDGIGNLANGLLQFPASIADTVIEKIENLAGVELPDVSTGMGAWVGVFENAWTALGLIVGKIRDGINSFVFDTKIKILEFVQDLSNTVSNMTGGNVKIAPDIQLEIDKLNTEQAQRTVAQDVEAALQEQINSGEIDLTVDMAGITWMRTGMVDAGVLEQMGADGKQMVLDALNMAFSEGDAIDIAGLLRVADMQGTDVSAFQEQITTMLPQLFAGVGSEEEGAAVIDLADLVGVDEETLRTKLQEALAMAAGGSGDASMTVEESTAFGALLQVATDLDMDIPDIYQQLDQSVIEAAAMGNPTVTLFVDIVAVPNSVDTSAIDAAVMGGAPASIPASAPASIPASVPKFAGGGKYENASGAGLAFLHDQEYVLTPDQQATVAALVGGGRGGGGDTWVVNSYGRNPYDLVDEIDRTKRGRGRR